MELNKEQKAVVDATEGQVLCIACPGSGKTTVIIERIHAMMMKGIPAESLLIITFTKEASLQMKERYEKAYGKSKIYFGTIHSVCFRILQHAYQYGTQNILQGSDISGFFFSLLYKKVNTDNFEEYVKNMVMEVSYVQNTGVNPLQYQPVNVRKEDFQKAFYEYQKFKRYNRKIDFDDMQWIAYDILSKRPDELAYWRQKFQYIMVDEYQDTNRIQANLFYLLAGENGNICVVGDDDQSCYRFRGADSRVFLDFPKQYPNARKYFLSVNYRSAQTIVYHADKLIKNNTSRYQKSFQTARNDAGELHVVIPKDSADKRIVHLILDNEKKGIPLNEMAVLYRINAMNQMLIGELLKNKIPFYCTEPPRDFHKDFIFQDVMCYYRLSRNIEQPGDLQRILNHPSRFLKSEPFKKCRFNQAELLAACEQLDNRRAAKTIFTMIHDIKNLREKNPSDFMKYLVDFMDYDSYITGYATWCQKDEESCRALLKNIQEEAAQFETMEQWIAYTEFYAEELERIRKEEKKEGVCLSTLHAAKGLEWRSVIIQNAVEGLYPYKKAKTEEDYEEERRLFYVGVTRAKDTCYIMTNGENPSRYIAELCDRKKEGKGQ